MGLQTEKFIFKQREIDSPETFGSCKGLLPQQMMSLVGDEGVAPPLESEEAIHGSRKS